MNPMQIEQYEIYFESLTAEYTDEPVEALCTIIKQDVLLTLELQRVLMVDYEIVWQQGKTMRAFDERDKDIAEELISNYTTYINEEESVMGIEEFLNSMFIPVEEVQSAVIRNYEVILKDIETISHPEIQPRKGPTLYPFVTSFPAESQMRSSSYGATGVYPTNTWYPTDDPTIHPSITFYPTNTWIPTDDPTLYPSITSMPSLMSSPSKTR